MRGIENVFILKRRLLESLKYNNRNRFTKATDGLGGKGQEVPQIKFKHERRARARTRCPEMCDGGGLTCSKHPVTPLMKQRLQTIQIKASKGSVVSFEMEFKRRCSN